MVGWILLVWSRFLEKYQTCVALIFPFCTVAIPYYYYDRPSSYMSCDGSWSYVMVYYSACVSMTSLVSFVFFIRILFENDTLCF